MAFLLEAAEINAAIHYLASKFFLYKGADMILEVWTLERKR